MSAASKKVSDSFTTQVQVITQMHLNGYERLFGGQLMSWMDIVAAVTARRHSGRNVTTARVEALDFSLPARANDTMILTGKVAYVGKTSMYVKVEAYIEELNGERMLTNRAWFVMVALDENDKPVSVPAIIPETEEDIGDMAFAARLREANSHMLSGSPSASK